LGGRNNGRNGRNAEILLCQILKRATVTRKRLNQQEEEEEY